MNMNALRVLFLTFVVLVAALVYLSCGWLPERVAANISSAGQATGYISREVYTALMTVVTALAPALVYCGTVSMQRAVPRRLLTGIADLPHGDPRRRRIFAAIERWGLMAAAVVAVFGAILHACIMRANTMSPPQFESWSTWSLLAAWLAFIGLAVFRYHRLVRRAV